MSMPHQQHKLSLEELTHLGEKFYFGELQDKLEKEHWDDYAVIDVEQKKYCVDPDQFTAIEKARKAFGEKLSRRSLTLVSMAISRFHMWRRSRWV